MNQYSEREKLDLFTSLFRGRTDVFAIRWEKMDKSGYMPAYYYDRHMYRLHQLKGGTFKDYKDKAHLPLTDYEFLKHLKGQQLIGIYPLLKDNTSWFIVADFDKDNWATESRLFIHACTKQNIPAYLERSRSGNGCHVWIFFDHPYPAIKSRKIFIAILEHLGIFSIFDKSSSFDRLFPNQDFHKGNGLGNLIALPLHKPTLEEGNSCFLDEKMEPYQDQWAFLSSIRRVSVTHLDMMHNSLQPLLTVNPRNINPDRLQIQLNNAVRLNRSAITPELINFLREELNFANSEYFIKKKTGKRPWDIERYFRLIIETEQEISLPRGFIGKLIRYCKQKSIDFDFQDERKKHNAIPFSTNLSLRPHQKYAIEAASRKEFGVIAAPPGSGKTVIGLKIIADKKQPALIIVHRKQLFEHWIERIQAFLEISKNEIGKIEQGKAKKGKAITVAMIQSLSKYLDKQKTNEFAQSFGTIIVDECHHIPAETFRDTISKLFPYYQYGLTATPFRKGNDGKIIFTHLGEMIAEIKPQEIEQYKRARVIVRETALDVPFNPKTDQFEILSKILVHDTARNRLILGDIICELNRGRKAVIITERKEHIHALNQFLKQSFEVITLSGDDTENSRKTKTNALNNGDYQALITTGQFFGEGSDLQSASCLFLVYPLSFKGKLIQYIGRVQRAEITPIIYDYRDHKIDYLNRLFLKRNTYYRHFDRQTTLFDDTMLDENPSMQTFTIEKKIKVPIEKLEFYYGAFAFSYRISEIKSEIEFEIENDEIRPEFDVLRPYFSKVLKTKYIEADIFIEFENSLLVSQKADSTDLERINREIIDSVKFRFIEKGLFGKKDVPGIIDKILGINKEQEGIDCKSNYNSEEQLLNDLLKNEKIRHYRQLRYLAAKHESDILKLRFVLNPFSFVFLLAGTSQYHIVLETLNTEEATYIWHVDKDKQSLSQELMKVDQDLNLIRNEGRHNFLEKHPDNFSRIIHDYTDDRKGFIVWKDQLEERLL